MMEKIDLKSLSLSMLQNLVRDFGWEPYRTEQILSWLYQKRITDIGSMSNLSLQLRETLKRTATISSLVARQVLTSRDGSIKFQFPLDDKRCIESVLIPERDHLTICLSTQLGCKLRCRFCRTGQQGLVRDLTVGEIVNQLGAVQNYLGERKGLRNIVLMGMGEPLANYENTLRALEIILHPSGFNFSHRRVTLSSAGLIPELERLGSENPVNLAISLNAADNETRSFLMPINRKYPLEKLLAVCRDYPCPNRKRITFEYILIAGVNDSLKDAEKLADLLGSIRCKINLIPFNEHPGCEFKRPDSRRIDAFRDLLSAHRFTAVVRESKGDDIMAACGQLGGDIDDCTYGCAGEKENGRAEAG